MLHLSKGHGVFVWEQNELIVNYQSVGLIQKIENLAFQYKSSPFVGEYFVHAQKTRFGSTLLNFMFQWLKM